MGREMNFFLVIKKVCVDTVYFAKSENLLIKVL